MWCSCRGQTNAKRPSAASTSFNSLVFTNSIGVSADKFINYGPWGTWHLVEWGVEFTLVFTFYLPQVDHTIGHPLWRFPVSLSYRPPWASGPSLGSLDLPDFVAPSLPNSYSIRNACRHTLLPTLQTRPHYRSHNVCVWRVLFISVIRHYVPSNSWTWKKMESETQTHIQSYCSIELLTIDMVVRHTTARRVWT